MDHGMRNHSLVHHSIYLEPPQGQIEQIVSNQQSDATYLKVKSGRWQLSEDPEDRKDGLWIWGLFTEPLYPFLLLQIDTEEYVIPGSNDGDAIQPLKLYTQINHKRDKKTGQVELDAAPLNIREFESVKGKCLLVWLCIYSNVVVYAIFSFCHSVSLS